MTPKERRALKRRVRARIVEAACRSKYHTVFGYSPHVTDPRHGNMVDRRRYARAGVDLDTEGVVVTIFNGNILRERDQHLRYMTRVDELELLDRLVWHPSYPCSPLIALAMTAVDQ